MKVEPINLEGLVTCRLNDRPSKVGRESFAVPWTSGGSFSAFVRGLPRILAAADLTEIAERIVRAVKGKRTVILAMGAHPIKVGLNPVIISLMERGVLSAVAVNGACVIHDTEVALVGRTSEDVAAGLGSGAFGMAQETAEFINRAVADGYRRGLGLGRSVGEALLADSPPFGEESILQQAARLGVPVTVHVALGTDIIHFHPGFDPEAAGGASHLDFRIFCRLAAGLTDGVFLNLGSAVILPEVFLKALSVVRNLGHQVTGITTVNMDFMRHYRPMTNVVQRPTMDGGKGFHLTGHHEIMFPLLAAIIGEGLE